MEEKSAERPLYFSLDHNTKQMHEDFGQSMDLLIREMQVGGLRLGLVMFEGMISLQSLSELIIEPLLRMQSRSFASPGDLFQALLEENIFSADQQVVTDFDKLYRFAMSGFVVMMVDGVAQGLVCGIQGFNFRSIAEPDTQVNVKGSKEGFVEALRINITMIRRRMKTPDLKFELLNVGLASKTDIALVYMTSAVSPKLLKEIKKRIAKIKLNVVLEAGYIQPFLEKRPLSIFSGIGSTERPDTLCAKVAEGRVGILVDGTPFALVAPFLFVENFQSVDDYTQRPYFATMIRWLKYFSFFLSILLPGLYVAIVSYHPELLPRGLLFHIAVAEQTTPFPIVFEALLIHVIYEIMREAGLRMPRSVGHAVSIIGALVIGETAVAAGLIGTPMVLIVAITAISSFVVPSIYESISILRISFILLGGFFGILGITLALAVVGVNMCAINPLGVPYMAPLSPLEPRKLRDVLVRAGWKQLGKAPLRVQNLTGSELKPKD